MDEDHTPNIQQVGASTNPFQHQTEALKARIFHGASKVEFSFFGAGKTNKEQPGPESFGRREREDMRQLAEINKVQTSTHATVNINGLSGFSQQSNQFDSLHQQKSLDELKKAIDFASEASTGGAVVFHTGEGPRSMWSHFQKEFRMHDKEEKEEIHYLVDPEEKRMIGAVKEDSYIVEPVQSYEKDKNGNYLYDENGHRKLAWVRDQNGNQVRDELTGRPIPLYDVSGGDIVTERMTFKDWRNKKIKDAKELGEKVPDHKKLVHDFFMKQQELNIQYQLGQSRYYMKSYQDAITERGKLIDALKYYSDLKERIPEDEWERNFVKTRMKSEADHAGYTIPEQSDPVEYLKEKLEVNSTNISYGKEIGLSGVRQAHDTYEKVSKAVFAEDFAHQQATDQMAKAAIHAFNKTQEKIRAGDELIKKNPLYISPESWRPEDYGGHPDEMKKLVLDARRKVASKLTNTYGEEKANKIAEQTIRATVDIGHMNTWKRHFVRKPGENQEAYDNRFKDWVLDKSKELAEAGVVGHVHLSDNFGYDDEHLAIGDGNAPVKDFVKIMRENGVEDFIAEAGSFNPMTALPDAWKELGSPVYRIGAPSAGGTMDAWGQFHQGYFGGTEGPRYIVGEYAPSDDFKGSPFYSGAPLE
ncbi:hypothetical protein BVX95_01320 [archaeon D22]|nr:hypothetical protein BVX95_01320 [archaeon D22]